MNLLVITNCTNAKAVKSGRRLTLEDFRDPERLRRREAELADLRRPAGLMYTGPQHVRLMRGINRLRQQLGADSVTLKIVSAGYGLIDEDRMIAPYDATFKGMKAGEFREWASYLGVARDVGQAISGHALVVFLLGDSYLKAIEPPLAADAGQRLIFFVAPSEANTLTRPDVTAVQAGNAEASRYRAGTVAVKGQMFDLMARGLGVEGERLWHALMEDDSPATVLQAIDIGGRYIESA